MDSINNGFTMSIVWFRADNDLVKMVETFGDRIHFTHLRSTCREANPKSSTGGAPSGDVNMVAVVDAILCEEQRRKQAGDLRLIPISVRIIHSQMPTIRAKTNLCYSAIGRPMAEVRRRAGAEMTKYPELP